MPRSPCVMPTLRAGDERIRPYWDRYYKLFDAVVRADWRASLRSADICGGRGRSRAHAQSTGGSAGCTSVTDAAVFCCRGAGHKGGLARGTFQRGTGGHTLAPSNGARRRRCEMRWVWLQPVRAASFPCRWLRAVQPITHRSTPACGSVLRPPSAWLNRSNGSSPNDIPVDEGRKPHAGCVR